MNQIKVKYHTDITPICKQKSGDWYDLRCAENVVLKKGDFKLISLGVSIELPECYEALLVPRSSTFKNFGIIQTNSIGVIDCSYNGDNDVWKLPVLATRDTTIPKDSRICQFRIIKNQPDCHFLTVDTIGNDDRGGFGSSGIE